MAEDPVDVRVFDHGSVMMVQPISAAAMAWVDENVKIDGWQWLGCAFAVDPRYLISLVEGMQDCGLVVE